MFSNPYPEKCCFKCEPISTDESNIHPMELQDALEFKAERRRSEFLTGRRCAQSALREAGFPFLPISRNVDRSPEWPFNAVGSITHGGSLAAAIVAKPFSHVKGVGIDIEDISRKIKTNITKHVLTDWEKKHWEISENPDDKCVKLIFSIKEAIYKCFHPVDKITLGFHDAEVESVEDGNVKARLLKNPFICQTKTPLELTGKIQFEKNLVMSVVIF